MTISLDTETTGVDFWHGSVPFFVTMANEQGEVSYWEWDVDPLTREPKIPPDDLYEIDYRIEAATGLVLQNSKFDVHALHAIGIVGFPWEKVDDTLIGGHLLASSQPHDLTSMVLHYLGRDIRPLESSLEECVKAARTWCRIHRPSWAIAKEDRPDMPSAGSRSWGADYWLPRAVAKDRGDPEPKFDCNHRWLGFKCLRCGGSQWWTVLRDYANADSQWTLPLGLLMKTLIDKRNLTEIYKERLRVLPVAWRMEHRGLSLSRPRLEELKGRYQQESTELGQKCVNIAASYSTIVDGVEVPYELKLPKGASPNDSIRKFCFDHLKLKPIYNAKAKSPAPTLNKEAISIYQETLPRNSKALTFVNTLAAKRKRDSYISYMNGYEAYWVDRDCDGLRLPKGEYVLHPNLNPTGTDTLRWSSSNPNEQNISKKGLFEGDPFTLRYIFGPQPGREWYSFDAKNIELRIPAFECGEEELIALFERPNDPPYYGSEHLLNFSTVYPDIWAKELKEVGLEKVGPHCKKKYASTWYQRVKNGGFAVGYGAIDRPGGDGTADRAFGRPGCHALLKARFAKKEKLNQHYIAFANKHGYVETIPDKSVGAKRGYPVMCSRTENGKIKPTVPLNYHVQSTAMWWTARAMVRVDDFFEHLNNGRTFAGKKWPGGYYIPIQQHDELVVDIPSGEGKGKNPWDYNRPIIDEIKRLMALGGEDIGIPTPVGCEYHKNNWQEGISI